MIKYRKFYKRTDYGREHVSRFKNLWLNVLKWVGVPV